MPTERHVDFSVFGTVPLEIYIETKDKKYLDMGQRFADRQWETLTPDGSHHRDAVSGSTTCS